MSGISRDSDKMFIIPWKVSCFEKKKECRTRWHEGMLLWRQMRHHHAINVCLARINSREFRNPPRLVALFNFLRQQQRDFFQRRFDLARKAIEVAESGRFRPSAVAT